MKKYRLQKLVVLTGLLLILMVLVLPDLGAQCPMCKMSAESNLKNGGTEGRSLNAGILYMLALPYLLVGFLGYVWWKKRKKDEAASPQ
ncbi:MAG: hypothetical protein IPP37_03840 [Saprospiraceae bacterium]|nr:hypothetical protein [Saprospiraceae bacterium]MBL0081601.1 hypothetical protein [Saprospiraceae bacterium]